MKSNINLPRFRKDTEPKYCSFMYSLVSLLSGIYVTDKVGDFVEDNCYAKNGNLKFFIGSG